MIVTKIEPITKSKFKIELDGEFAFVLYKSELSHYSVKETEELSEENFLLIKKEVQQNAALPKAKTI